MRVIAGSARGVPLFSPKDDAIRPTLDRVRESLFNILAARVPGATFLDLFAGTGANGIEALSRGAAKGVFVDKGREALELIRKNVEKSRVAKESQIFKLDLPGDLKLIHESFDLIFADPPHSYGEFDALGEAITTWSLLKPGGMLILEHASSAQIADEWGALNRVRHKKYGQTTLSFYA